MNTLINRAAQNFNSTQKPKNTKKNKTGMTKPKTGMTKPKTGMTKPKTGMTKQNKRITKKAGRVNSKPGMTNTKKQKNRSLVGKMPNFDDSASEIKMSKKGLRKILKSLFSDMGLSDNEMLKLLKDLGKDEQSVQNLTKFINKTKEADLKKKSDIIRNMNEMKDSILSIYKLFDQLNNNLGILFERKKPQ
jgi:hypothetical protein